MSTPTNVLVVGRGMYATGRGIANEENFGTILPALFQAHRAGLVGNISFCGTTTYWEDLDAKTTELTERFGLQENPVKEKYPHPRDVHSNENYFMRAIPELKNPGAVIISTPDPTHTIIALHAMAAKKHVMIVKPATPTVVEGITLIQEHDEHPELVVQVEYHKRNDKRLIDIRRQVRSGQLGQIGGIGAVMNESITLPLDFIRSRLEKGERLNPFDYIGCHFTDGIYYITGCLPIEVTATGTYGKVREAGINELDSTIAKVTWAASPYCLGFTSTQTASWTKGEYDPANRGQKTWPSQEITIYGQDGKVLFYDQSGSNYFVIDNGEKRNINLEFSYPYQDNTGLWRFEGYGPQTYYNFLELIQQPLEVRQQRDLSGICDLRQALVATALSQAVRESLEQGRPEGDRIIGETVEVYDLRQYINVQRT